MTTSSNYVHSGTRGVRAGPTGSLGYITQNLPTCSGQAYLLSFWLRNQTSGSVQQFQASWNGSVIYNNASPGALAWTNVTFKVTATGTSTALQFGFRNDTSYFGLDDISITPLQLPAITQQPTSQTNVAGSNVVFAATATGTAPLAYQWRTNGVNLVNGSNLSGATSNVLTLTAVTTNSAGNYTLVVTNLYGSATSSVAMLTVVLPPIITVPPTNQTIQCGSNAAFSVTATGTTPLKYQWSLDGAAITGATNTSLSLTNVHLPNHTVAIVVTNLYGSVTSSVTLTVQDTLAPVITLNGANPFDHRTGVRPSEPGATANDLCAGAVPVTTNGTVNTNAVGANIRHLHGYRRQRQHQQRHARRHRARHHAAGNLWSFTNLVLAAGANCSATMPDVTGTNFILATDLSGALPFR